MIEIQFSVEKGKLFHLIDKLKNYSQIIMFIHIFLFLKKWKSHTKNIFLIFQNIIIVFQ